jgi:Domain of unknown function (DUF397)
MSRDLGAPAPIQMSLNASGRQQMTLVDGRWRRPDSCESGGCVEVAKEGDRVFVRRSDDPHGPWLTFSDGDWGEFLAAVRAGAFDRRSRKLVRRR